MGYLYSVVVTYIVQFSPWNSWTL